MTGITIGVGEVYSQMAQLAADCVRQMCDLEVIVLTEREFKESGLYHPAALKLKIFELAANDQLFYFDADWFCVAKWPLNTFIGGKDLFACRDFILTDDWPDQYSNMTDLGPGNNTISYNTKMNFENCRMDYIREIQEFMFIKMHYSNWVNTGLFIANRAQHEVMFGKALEYYLTFPGHHTEYYEQPAMNLAIDQTATNVTYLERQMNMLVARRMQWPCNVTGLHVKLKRHPDFIKKVLEKKITNSNDVRNYFSSQSKP